MNGTIIRQLHGRCLELTIDNPAHDNAVSDDMARELADLLDAAADEADLVVLRGAGADFCSGRMSMGKRSGTQPQALDRRRKTEVIFRCYDAFRATPVPVIGVVRGRAHGFGCAIAALCDITLAASTASFQIPEMAHNILPTMVMSALIDRMPAKELAYLVYSTREIDAAAALAYGLVSEVVPDAGLDAAFEALRSAMLNMPRPALCGIKEYLRSAPDMSIRGAVDFAQNLHATVNSSNEMLKQKD
ncbi:enoyl-CoA hydratase/isomerase family protein [Paraburkholderia sp. RL18-101-BIB-B]|uniref:enoyl-CoA hydratase/isomerase family protein n=1 Tax=unclassified Paraburkholderia TaxID=2615204 RepID=UPI0038BB354C